MRDPVPKSKSKGSMCPLLGGNAASDQCVCERGKVNKHPHLQHRAERDSHTHCSAVCRFLQRGSFTCIQWQVSVLMMFKQRQECRLLLRRDAASASQIIVKKKDLTLNSQFFSCLF